MKKTLTSIAAAALLLFTGCQQNAPKVAPAIPQDAGIEQQVENKLKEMTLEEKIGQMTELVLDLVSGRDSTGQITLDEVRLREILSKYKVGSFLNQVQGESPTPAEWQRLMEIVQRISMEEIGIPCIYGLDQNHGTTYTAGGTLFPQNINMGATFNRDLVYQACEACAYETRACSVPWTYNPTIDLSRNPCWPRVWENFGEDCYVNAEMGMAAVRGFQGDDPNHIDERHIAACLKHYMAYGSPVSGKDRTPASVTLSELKEKQFAPFKAAIQAGALSVMVNSGSNNGMPFHANHELLTGWLKEGLNWDGMIVTDWSDINNLWQRDKVAADKKSAIVMAINAGIDMAMEPYNTDFCDLLKEAVEEGLVPMSRIDDATRRVLRLKYRLGLFDHPTQDASRYVEFASAHAADLSRQAAIESMVLLKNQDQMLPLAAGKRILVCGPCANTMRTLHGGWSYSWQGNNTERYTSDYLTIYQALCQKVGADRVKLAEGVTFNMQGKYYEENEPQIQQAVSAAAGCDVILCCIGENSYAETPGNLTDLTLSQNQRDLVKALAKTGKPVILVLNEGRPRIIADIEPLAKAVVHAMVPGNYGGEALAELLMGDANFSGRLPYTYPLQSHSLITYDYKPCQETATMEGAYDYNAVVDVQWPFGFGLSYTTFEYSNLRASAETFRDGDQLTFTVDVKNTGSRVGKESVLLFSSDLVASSTPDVRRLRQFTKVELQPGEQQSVELTIAACDLAFVDYYGQWVLEAGDFRMQVGNQVVNITCAETKKY